MTESQWSAILFHSVSHALLAEKLLKQESVPHKLVPVPRHISSDCGVCIRFARDDREAVMRSIDGRVDIREVRDL